jgi:hypothetical protein
VFEGDTCEDEDSKDKKIENMKISGDKSSFAIKGNLAIKVI